MGIVLGPMRLARLGGAACSLTPAHAADVLPASDPSWGWSLGLSPWGSISEVSLK